MPKTRRLSLAFKAVCALLPVLLAGCATPMLQDVGAVMVVPKVQIPPVPAIVLQTTPKPAGYFQQALLNYSSGSPLSPTPSTTPTPVAGPTPSTSARP